MATRPPNTALDPLADKLRQVRTIAELMQYLHEELGWPVDVDDWEVNLFDWQPEEINLKAEHVVKVKSIKQLRPLVSGQPWGIFFVELNKGRLPITALRRVLNGLVPKGRAASGGHQTWAAHDLLFVSSFGESNAREIALAHFTDESAKGDLPTLRVLGWDDDDTPSQNHPPPDAATLAAEQMVQKEQLKAQKKAATATKKRAAPASPTGATSLFDFDDGLGGLVAASGNLNE